ncbi:ABC transporter permease [Halostreptopolyspora alba]|uniref:ABC transporter permease n=1 Tax=Halostreptopolyspora alba TaxID=2487137 RepID=A0A3N0EE03_9ACTN|nr:ABC transporter permease [Nocardiopsaceae bacterium YIM 96095]
MPRMIARRVLYGFLILNVMTVALFVLVRMVPGDPVRAQLADAAVSEEQLAELTAELGLDAPIAVQLGRWYADAARGDLGESYALGRPVTEVIAERLPVTLELTVMAVLLGVVVGLAAGAVSAARRGSWIDNIVRVGAALGLSMPNFWIGLLLISFVSVVLGWLPPLSYRGPTEDLGTNLAQLVLPAIALAVGLSASIARMSRSAMLDVLGSDFVRTLRAKGSSEFTVFRHALRNSLIPVLTLVGVQLGALLGGTVILEQIFALPGLGRTVFEAVGNRDYPLLQVSVLLFGFLFITINLLVDISYGVVNPRMRATSR